MVISSSLDISTWGSDNTTITYGYDANGSLTTKVTAVTDGADTEVVTYTYNLQNRLSRVVTDSDPAVSDNVVDVVDYTYNPAGIRVAKYNFTVAQNYLGGTDEQTYATDDVYTTYLIDPANHTGYAQTLEEWRQDGNTATLITYTIGDDVIAQQKSDWTYTTDWAQSTVYDTQYMLYDGHGSTRQLAKQDGSIIDSYSYDGYGVLLQNEDNFIPTGSQVPGQTPAQATNLLYAGQHFDADSQQYYNRARWYTPLNGRFNRVDPYAGNTQDPQSLHKYAYCHHLRCKLHSVFFFKFSLIFSRIMV